MLSIRLQRVGRRNRPSYRIVVVEKTTGPKSGKFVEKVGFYNPIQKEKKIDGDRVKYWISNGAQVSNTLNNLLISEKILEGKKINVLPKKTVQAKEKIEEVKDSTATTEKTEEPETETKTENTDTKENSEDANTKEKETEIENTGTKENSEDTNTKEKEGGGNN